MFWKQILSIANAMFIVSFTNHLHKYMGLFKYKPLLWKPCIFCIFLKMTKLAYFVPMLWHLELLEIYQNWFPDKIHALSFNQILEWHWLHWNWFHNLNLKIVAIFTVCRHGPAQNESICALKSTKTEMLTVSACFKMQYLTCFVTETHYFYWFHIHL